ncbi:MAG: SMI1/KNR4 family protein [Micropruina sp.]|nr:MAG: SMI1/KNR4 family protein [Micropruina sp.]
MTSSDDTAALQRLSETLAAHGRVLDVVATPATTAARVRAELGLPEEFTGTYAAAGPADGSSVPWVVEELFLFSLAELPNAQDGYRWSGPDRERLTDWPSSWVVVASVFADPFLVDTREPGFPVRFARHGAGEWRTTLVSPTLAAFYDALAVLESSLLGDFGGDAFDVAGLRPEFTERVSAALHDVLDPEQAAAFVQTLE